MISKRSDKMTPVKCLACKKEFVLDEKNVDKNSGWMECPFCGSLSKNPFKENEYQRRK
jgi:DNA-directed RNA polymerase subunit RPC12/RpoP